MTQPLRFLILILTVAVTSQAIGQIEKADKLSLPSVSQAVELFDKKIGSLPENVRSRSQALRCLIERYLRDEVVTSSEEYLADALLDEIGFWKVIGRKGDGGRPDVSSLLPPAKPTPAPPKPTPDVPTPKPPSTHMSKPDRTHPAGLLKHATFVSGVTPLKGRSLGYINLSVDSKVKRIVEIPAVGKWTGLQRAQIIARRMTACATADGVWWIALSSGTVNNQTVVSCPSAAEGYIITADLPFATEWGLSRDGLVRLLIKRIRTTFDPKTTRYTRTKGDDVDGRDTAIDLRIEGDELNLSSPINAESKYRAAIKADQSYAVPYLRLAELLHSRGAKAELEALVGQARSANLTPADLAILERIGGK